MAVWLIPIDYWPIYFNRIPDRCGSLLLTVELVWLPSSIYCTLAVSEEQARRRDSLGVAQ